MLLPGIVFGTLCVIDTKGKPNYDPVLLDFLQGCADEVAAMIAENPSDVLERASSKEVEAVSACVLRGGV